MGFLKKLFTNCAHPKGRMGRVMLKFMNASHGPLNNWGLDLVKIQDGWTMLDIGFGGGASLKRMLNRSKGGMVYGIDISEESVEKARKLNADVLGKQIFIQQGSVSELPYDDWKFDLVTAVETVYFWPNLPECIKEVYRVVKPGGRFAIMVEVVVTNSKWMDLVEGMTAYPPEQLQKFLEDAGFKNIEIHRMKPSYATIIGMKV